MKSFNNTLGSAAALFNAKYLRRYSPLIVGFSLLNSCTNKCIYCNTWIYDKNQLKTPEILKIIEELALNGCKRISFTGGEPLLRKDIGQIIDYSKKKGLIVGLNSNGNLVKNKIEDIINLDILTLSLDGPCAIHDKQRGKGSYGKVMEAINVAKDNNIRTNLTCVLTKYNINSVEFLINKAEKEKCIIFFQPVSLIPLGKKKICKLRPDKKEFSKAIDILINSRSKYIGNSLGGLNYLKKWPGAYFKECCAAKIYCAVDPNGNLYSCSNLRDQEQGKNILKMGFRKSFDSLNRKSCMNCWCSSKLEMNYLLALDFDAIKKSLFSQI